MQRREGAETTTKKFLKVGQKTEEKWIKSPTQKANKNRTKKSTMEVPGGLFDQNRVVLI